jgi:hypothetical protein
MTYKICARCLFAVPEKKKLCTTCGSTKFVAPGQPLHPVIPESEKPSRSTTQEYTAAGPMSLPLPSTQQMSSLREKFAAAEMQPVPSAWEQTWTRVVKAIGGGSV